MEIIVVDDGSTDDTRERLGAVYGDRIRYIHQQNRGLSATRNNGIRAARGEFIALLDSDDIWLPDKLEKQESPPSVSKIHTPVWWPRSGLRSMKKRETFGLCSGALLTGRFLRTDDAGPSGVSGIQSFVRPRSQGCPFWPSADSMNI